MSSLQYQLSKIHAKIQRKVNDSLKNEVSEVAKREISKSVETHVYSMYQPTKYWRRKYSEHGLADKTNINTTLIESGKLMITDDAPFNPYNNDGTYEPPGEESQIETGKIDMSKSLGYNIEYGWGNQNTDYSEPRPFMSMAKREMENGKIRSALKKGLLKRGLNVK